MIVNTSETMGKGDDLLNKTREFLTSEVPWFAEGDIRAIEERIA